MIDEYELNKKRKILPKPEDQVFLLKPTYLRTIDGEPVYISENGPVTLDPLTGRIRRVRVLSHMYVADPRPSY